MAIADYEGVAEQVLLRLDKLADWTNSAGGDVLAIYVTKAQASSVGFFLAGVGVVCLGLVALHFGRKLQKEGMAECAPVYLVAAAGLAFGLSFFWHGYMRLMIPEYYAIQELLRTVL